MTPCQPFTFSEGTSAYGVIGVGHCIVNSAQLSGNQGDLREFDGSPVYLTSVCHASEGRRTVAGEGVWHPFLYTSRTFTSPQGASQRLLKDPEASWYSSPEWSVSLMLLPS